MDTVLLSAGYSTGTLPGSNQRNKPQVRKYSKTLTLWEILVAGLLPSDFGKGQSSDGGTYLGLIA